MADRRTAARVWSSRSRDGAAVRSLLCSIRTAVCCVHGCVCVCRSRSSRKSPSRNACNYKPPQYPHCRTDLSPKFSIQTTQATPRPPSRAGPRSKPRPIEDRRLHLGSLHDARRRSCCYCLLHRKSGFSLHAGEGPEARTRVPAAGACSQRDAKWGAVLAALDGPLPTAGPASAGTPSSQPPRWRVAGPAARPPLSAGVTRRAAATRRRTTATMMGRRRWAAPPMSMAMAVEATRRAALCVPPPLLRAA